jgi:hypothetical protein
MGAIQLKIQQSSLCWGTADYKNKLHFRGSIPEAIKVAIISRV